MKSHNRSKLVSGTVGSYTSDTLEVRGNPDMKKGSVVMLRSKCDPRLQSWTKCRVDNSLHYYNGESFYLFSLV